MSTIKITTALAALLVLAGCFQTEPVRVPTEKGDVVCQLYTRNMVAWDHAVSHPRDMDVRQADRICFEMGYGIARERTYP